MAWASTVSPNHGSFHNASGVVEFDKVDVEAEMSEENKKGTMYYVLKNEEKTMHSVRSLQNKMKPISHADMKVQEAKRKKELKQRKLEAQNELYKRVLGKSYAREGGRGHR